MCDANQKQRTFVLKEKSDNFSKVLVAAVRGKIYFEDKLSQFTVFIFHANYGQLQQSARDQSKHEEVFVALPALRFSLTITGCHDV